MGNNQSFESIEKKYGDKGVEYVVGKYQERKIYETINDEIARLNVNADLQEKDDLEFLRQQKARLDQALKQGKQEIQKKKPGAIKQAEARHKVRVEKFSGFDDHRVKLENSEKQIREKYVTQRTKMSERVHEQVKKHKSGGSSLNRIPEYDRHPDNYRRVIENECIKLHPEKAKTVDATSLERKLTWPNYKQNFESIVNKDQVRREVDSACNEIKNNITGGSAGVCCC